MYTMNILHLLQPIKKHIKCYCNIVSTHMSLSDCRRIIFLYVEELIKK